MAQLKLLILLANLVLVRSVFATTTTPALEDDRRSPREAKSSPGAAQDEQSPSMSILDNINSLDFGPGSEQQVATLGATTTTTTTTGPTPPANGGASSRAGKSTASQKSKKRRATKASGQTSIGHLVLSLLGQLEKLDMRRLIADSLDQFVGPTRRSSGPHPHDDDAAAVSGRASTPAEPVAAGNGTRAAAKVGGSVELHPTAATNGTKPVKRLNVSALSAETGNLLSITKQLVRLARGSMDFGGPHNYPAAYSMGGGGAGSWMSPSMMAPSMLSAASHMIHDSGDFLTGASLKSDWFWLVAPAVIVIGAGVIVIPLIAAWLVSHMMNQNTFTVSAGRRRRKRSTGPLDDGAGGGAGPHRAHSDLMRMLDIYRLLDDAPEILVNQLSRFHSALDSVTAQYIETALLG